MRIKLLDLFCGAGGCSVGYFNAATSMGIQIEIIGVDINKQKSYPFPFIQSDAVTYLQDHYNEFSHVHASPTCQLFSSATGQWRKREYRYPDTLTPVRDLMYKLKVRGVIENVMGSPVRPDIVLNGTMFGLKVIRKRKFELINWFCMKPGSGAIRKNLVGSGEFVSVYGKNKGFKAPGGGLINLPGKTVTDKWRGAMGVPWMANDGEISQATPPAYTQYIGSYFFK